MPIRIFREWLKWRKNWDALCNCCGKCCYERRVKDNGEVFINHFAPCKYLDVDTNLCTIYSERLEKYACCRKVTLRVALFHPTLPNDCPYRTTFRLWEQKKSKKRAG